MGDVVKGTGIPIAFIEGDGSVQIVDADHPLPIGSGDITIAPGDVEIGAVEIKDVTGENRAAVDGTGRISVVDSAVLGAVDGVEGKLDTLHTDLSAVGTATTNDDVTVDSTSGGVQILASNSSRKGFIVQNTGANNIRVSIGNNPTTTHGIQLAAGASLAMSAPNCPTGAIKAIREGGSNSTCAAIEVV
jgi:hypothetical protein